jgi:hypothetical protein
MSAPGRRWIVGPRYDLFFFVGSGVFTFLFYGLYRWAERRGLVLGGDSILVTYFVFTAFFDHPHIFQTFSRTHLDSREFAKRRGLHTWGLAAFVAAGFAVLALGWEARLLVLASIYGTWHIIRQHHGLIRAYKALNDDMEPIDNWLDGATFFTGMFACLFNDYSDIRGPVVIYRDLQASFPSLPADAGALLWKAFLALLVVHGARQTWRVMEGKPLNVPKLLLMGAALSTHYFVFFVTATPFLVAEALETAYHNVQYQGWILRYQNARFAGGMRLAAGWLAAAFAYGLAVGVVEVLGLSRGGWAMWAFVPFTMVVLYHYYVDGLVWRFREDAELARLMLPRPAPAQEKGPAPAREPALTSAAG